MAQYLINNQIVSKDQSIISIKNYEKSVFNFNIDKILVNLESDGLSHKDVQLLRASLEKIQGLDINKDDTAVKRILMNMIDNLPSSLFSNFIFELMKHPELLTIAVKTVV